MNKRVLSSVLFYIIVFVFTGCNKTIDVAEIIGTGKMNTENYRASFVIDESDIVAVTTYASYVFVADVVKYDKTEYLTDDADTPITYYNVRVRKNLKGNLRDDEDIVLKKAGGLRRGTDTFLVCEGDILPEPGKTYVFAAVILEDDLYCPMPNMVAEVEDCSKLENSVIIQNYIDACGKEAPDVINGNNYRSKYDVGAA